MNDLIASVLSGIILSAILAAFYGMFDQHIYELTFKESWALFMFIGWAKGIYLGNSATDFGYTRR